MIGSRWTTPALRAFETVFLPWMRRRLYAVRIAGLPRDLPTGAPLVIVANHVSWWDGFLLREVQRELRPRAPVFAVMAAPELRRHPYLGWIGALPLRQGSPGGVLRLFRFLRSECTRRSDTVVLFFPQGRVWPSFRRPLGFQRGVGTLVRTLAPAIVLPVGIHIEPLTAPGPTVFIAAAGPLRISSGPVDARELETRVQAVLDTVLGFLARHGEEAPDRWPGPFDRLPDVPAPARVRDAVPPGARP